MRIIVFSDSHGHFREVRRMFEKTHLFADLYIFLGDGEKDFEDVPYLYPDAKILAVRGNCDIDSLNPVVSAYEAEGKKIIFVHGNIHMVNYGLSDLRKLAAENGADVVLYGHTHERRCEYKDGVYYLNPGSIGDPRDGKGPGYALLEVLPAGVLCNHVDLE